MIYKVPSKFGEGFKNFRNLIKKYNSSLYSDKDYKIISETIEKIFGYKVITELYGEKIDTHQPIISRNEELKIFNEYGFRNYDINRKYRLDGLLTFDNYYKRFVIILFYENLIENEISWDLIDGVIPFNNFIFSDYKQYKINDPEINSELTKVIIFYKKCHYKQLISLLDPHPIYENKRVIELWEFIKLEKINIIKKNDFEFKNIIWTNEEISEKELFNIFGIDEDIIYKLEIFKEYLKFNFSNIHFNCIVEGEKLDEFVESIYLENDIEPWDRIGKYTDGYHGNLPIDKISYLKDYLKQFKENLNFNSVSYNNLILDYRSFIKSYFSVETDFISYKDEIYEKYYYHDFIYNMSFINHKIILELEFNEDVMEKEIGKIELKNTTSFNEIEKYIKSSLEIRKIRE
jgi:hypothetical protein